MTETREAEKRSGQATHALPRCAAGAAGKPIREGPEAMISGVQLAVDQTLLPRLA